MSPLNKSAAGRRLIFIPGVDLSLHVLAKADGFNDGREDFDYRIGEESKPGQVVVAEMVDYPTQIEQATGRIVQVLGSPDEKGIATEIAIHSHAIPNRWPRSVAKEVERFGKSVPSRAKEGRYDLRDVDLVTIDGAEDAPTLDNLIADQTATEDSPFSFTVPANTFSDVDASDTLTYTATLSDDSPLPAWLSFDALPQTFSGTPTNADIGTISVKVTADDGTSTVNDVFDLTVTNTNDPPVIGGIDTATLTEDIDPDLDHGRGDQQLHLALFEPRHRPLLGGGFHAAVDQIHFDLGQRLGQDR